MSFNYSANWGILLATGIVLESTYAKDYLYLESKMNYDYGR